MTTSGGFKPWGAKQPNELNQRFALIHENPCVCLVLFGLYFVHARDALSVFYYSLLSLIFRGGVFQQSLNIIETINITESGDLGDPQLFTSNSTPNNVQNWPKRGRKGNPQIRG